MFTLQWRRLEDLGDHREVYCFVAGQAEQLLRRAEALGLAGRGGEQPSAGDCGCVSVDDRIAPARSQLNKCTLERTHGATSTFTILLETVGQGQDASRLTCARKTKRVATLTRTKRQSHS